MVYTSIEIIQQCNLPIAILPFKLLLPMHKPHLVCLNILCILAKQERHNFSTYARLPLRIYTNIKTCPCMPANIQVHAVSLPSSLLRALSLTVWLSLSLSLHSSFLQQLCLIFEN